MKLYYSKILLFVIPLNILVNTHRKTYNTPHHTPTTTSRVLSECDTQSSIYDKDEEIISVKEIFDRRTSQRLREYDERLQEKRQKRKEQRDKNIQKIIHKDKMEKNLAEKLEKGCLMCGCGLGSVAGSVGLFGGVAINIWKPGALDAAIAKAIAEGTAEIAAAAKTVGEAEIIKLIKSKFVVSTLGGKDLGSFFTTTSYKNITSITQAVSSEYVQKCISDSSGNLVYLSADAKRNIPICNSVLNPNPAVSQQGKHISYIEVIEKTVQTMVSDAEVSAKAAAQAAEVAEKAKAIKTSTDAIEATNFSIQGY
ncbi:rifin PIR protein, putative [Plasmodium reichenowi]|uniref:Rifin PIR protein, putative n=1 Tax=Plasmodium reichenowi TaxID=5854 RepID=A0A2P9DSJ7_PLARE|nr:rifin PIR protein, putative [Plasmodium reichenowi]